MKYILGELLDSKILVDSVNTDPKNYVHKFEPIDIVDGRLYAWDESGERYVFLLDSFKSKSQPNGSKIQIVDVGQWDEDGPKMQSDGHNDLSLLKPALEEYILPKHHLSYFVWSRKKKLSIERETLSRLDVRSLFDLATKISKV